MKEKAKVIVVANRKGGCGKTTTVKNIAYNLSQKGKKILIVDFDPQCNLTDGLTNRSYKKTVIGLLKNESIEKCIFNTRFENLDIIPGNDYLASEEIKDDLIMNQLNLIKDTYDYIVIDTSPYFNKLIAEVMKPHDLIIIPSEIGEDSIKGMMTTIEELSMLCGSHIKFRVLYTKVDDTAETRNDLSELQDELRNVSFKTFIRYNFIPIKRARKRRIPLSKRYKLAKATKDYQDLCIEIMEVL